MADPVTLLVNVAVAVGTTAIANALAPTQKFEGPRLDDLRVQTSTLGKFRPIPFGTVAYAGNVLWLENNELKETRHKESSGGKGGPKVENTTYTYSATFAVGFGVGPIGGILRIWADSVLIYDASSADPAAVYESGSLFDRVTIYPGTETQEVNARIEADDPNTSAFRGEAYIVFEDFQLEKFGNRIPNITAEIVQPSLAGNYKGLLTSQLFSGLTLKDYYPVEFNDGVLSVKLADNTGNLKLFDLQNNYLGIKAATYQESPGLDATFQKIHCFLSGRRLKITSISHPAEIYTINDSGAEEDEILAPLGIAGPLMMAAPSADDNHLFLLLADPSDTAKPAYWYILTSSGSGIGIYDQGVTSGFTSTYSYLDFSFAKAGYANSFNPYRCGVMENNLKHIWTAYGASAGQVILYEINDNKEFVHVNNMDALPYFNFSHPCIYADNGVAIVVSDRGVANPGDGFIAYYSRDLEAAKTSYPLDDLINDLRAKTWLEAADIDATPLSSINVDGYVVSKLGELKNALEPLQIAYLFDALESEYKLKFVKRGGASVATIPESDLAAYEYGQDRPQPLPVLQIRESKLPQKTKVSYISSARDYEPDMQESERIVTDSESVSHFDLPVVLSDDKAAQLAEIYQQIAWVERWKYETFTLPYKYSYLEPSDVIDATYGGATHSIRIEETNIGRPGVVECRGVAQKTAHYTSEAVGVAGQASNQTISPVGPTNLVLLDIPLLRDQDNDSGFYIAAGGYYSSWPGCVVMKSTDGGVTYTQMQSVVNGSTIGYLTAPPTTGEATVIDTENTINVSLFNNGTLSSVTQSAMLADANAAAIGADGRWVIIKFQNATLEGDGSYTLSNIMWGYQGTESNLSSLASGDTFVMLTDSMIRAPANDNEIGLERHYKAVTLGKNETTAQGIAFTNNAVSLKPYAPAHILGSRDGSGNLTIDFTRRTRIGGEWRDLVNASLGEDSESYEVDVMNGSTVVRTIAVTSPTASYTAAQQTTDFGSTQSSVEVNIYQLSATVGRGYAGNATI